MLKKIALALGVLFFLSGPGWAQAPLTGLWIDNRTANDFWEINGNDEGFRFTAYGGSPSEPRYLSRGVALALEEGQLYATLKDLPGRCCGQQGSLRIKVVSPNQLEVTGEFWPVDNKADAVPVSFTLTREGVPLNAAASVFPSITYDNPASSMEPGATSPTWDGSWHGDGWASFFIQQKGNLLQMYWYYSQESPFYGLYTLSEDGKSASGTAVSLVASPGNTFYYHELKLNNDPLQITVTMRRLAAPLEDGRWVSFSNAPPTSFVLQKVSDTLPVADKAHLANWFEHNQPGAMLQATLDKAANENHLIKRNYD